MAGATIILGAGMGGLFTALALSSRDEPIVILERDPPPPTGDPDEVFETWRRRSAGQFRHTHAFRARLTSLLRKEHPAFLASLADFGMRVQPFVETLPPEARVQFGHEPSDAELDVLIGRRSTFELALRRYLQDLPNIEFRDRVLVQGLKAGRGPKDELLIEGVLTADGPIEGSLVIDTGGRNSPVADWLESLGARPPEEVAPAGIVYFSQFYRLRPGAVAPVRAAVGDLGYLKFGAIPADNGAFSITLAVPESDLTLRQLAVRPEMFERIVTALPAVAAWIDPQVAMPVGRPAGMGDLKSRWRDMAPSGRPLVLNLFCVGDSLVLTNPLYGRGCTLAAVEAHLLRDALLESDDPSARATSYSAKVSAEVRGYFDDMRLSDAQALDAARRILGEAATVPWLTRARQYYQRHGVVIAVRRRPVLMRESLRAFHLLAPATAWRTHPRTIAYALFTLARGRANAALYDPPLGPPRAELLARLGDQILPKLRPRCTRA
jgi:2-polyprenyl-6-methoxyphenol hydroxylase-like FAD-dependent oxidoreductase